MNRSFYTHRFDIGNTLNKVRNDDIVILITSIFLRHADNKHTPQSDRPL